MEQEEKLELMAKVDKMFANKKTQDTIEQPVQPIADRKEHLVDAMFEQAVINQVATNEDLQDKVLNTAEKYTKVKMNKIETDVDTEFKEAVFNNNRDACESYGFDETKTPIWAVKFMRWGYNIMLAIWLFIGSFTFMPVIFVAKKVSVGVKRTWIAGLIAIILYVCATVLPIVTIVVSQG